jgi:hypothetical protein
VTRYQGPDSVFQTSSAPGWLPGSFPLTPDLAYGFQGDGTQNRAIYRDHKCSQGTDLSRAESAIGCTGPARISLPVTSADQHEARKYPLNCRSSPEFE